MKIFFILYIYFSLFFLFDSKTIFINPIYIKSIKDKIIERKNINQHKLYYDEKIKIKRILEQEIDENEKENNITNKDNNTDIINDKNKNKKNKNSGIGWLGTTIIIILSIVVFYVLYVGFRYYRRKKYQNPSFYYKITEEMFADITPIE